MEEGVHGQVVEGAEADGVLPAHDYALPDLAEEALPEIAVIRRRAQLLAVNTPGAVVLTCFAMLSGLPRLDILMSRSFLQVVQFLRSCDYAVEEISSVLAHATLYLQDLTTSIGPRVASRQLSAIFVALSYMAHCYVLDETCPLSYWHQSLCAEHCRLKELDAAVIRLMSSRNYVLRCFDTATLQRYAALYEWAVAAAARGGV